MSIDLTKQSEYAQRDRSPALEGKIAIATGAARGIGKAIAKAMIGNGAMVVVADILEDVGAKTTRELGEQALFVPCDVSDASQVCSLVEGIVKRCGRLDIMVNNAGINAGDCADRVTIDEYSVETWQRIVDVDLNGVFYCCKAAARQMINQKSGCIINIASVAGVVALRLQIGYVAAKAGVLRMTEAMACELAPHGIRVNAVSPGSILTNGTRQLFYGDRERSERILSFIPDGRPGEVEEIADAVVFLASDSASYINGHNLIVDGGWTSGFNRDF